MSTCACMGPQKGDPLCPCIMISSGIKLPEYYKMPEKDAERLKTVLKEIFKND